MSIELRGLNQVQAALQALPRQIDRASQNAINASLTQIRRVVVDELNAQLGLKKKLARSYLVIVRARTRVLEGRIWAADVPLPLNAYRYSLQRISPTRATVNVQDRLGGGVRTSKSAFMNPASSLRWLRRQGPWRRVNKRRLPIRQAKGPSLAIHLRTLQARPAFVEDTHRIYRAHFEQKLADQLRKRGR